MLIDVINIESCQLQNAIIISGLLISEDDFTNFIFSYFDETPQYECQCVCALDSFIYCKTLNNYRIKILQY